LIDKRQIARIILQRNHYKERFFEAQDRLRAIEIEARTQPEAQQHLRKRDMALSLFAGLVEGVRNFADGVKQELGEFIAPSPESQSSSSSSILTPSATSTALRNILGNFVGQAVTYTADAVLGTGNDLPRDVSRPMIAARVNSNLSNKTETDVPTASTSHPMYTDHL
uniref:Dot/Icm secretion system substrate n=1 Tax=Rodentolepis nana TaxID=102285 RepID=A0A0R3T323_RODNA